MAKKKKKNNPVRQFILDKTGATAVIEGFERGNSKRMTVKPNPINRGARVPAGTAFKTDRKKKKKR